MAAGWFAHGQRLCANNDASGVAVILHGGGDISSDNAGIMSVCAGDCGLHNTALVAIIDEIIDGVDRDDNPLLPVTLIQCDLRRHGAFISVTGRQCDGNSGGRFTGQRNGKGGSAIRLLHGELRRRDHNASLVIICHRDSHIVERQPLIVAVTAVGRHLQRTSSGIIINPIIDRLDRRRHARAPVQVVEG